MADISEPMRLALKRTEFWLQGIVLLHSEIIFKILKNFRNDSPNFKMAGTSEAKTHWNLATLWLEQCIY